MRSRALLLSVLIACTTAVSSAQSPFEVAGIRSGLLRSPDDFVAGVFEHIGPIRCSSGAQGGQLCWTPVLVIDEIASRPTSKAPRLRLKVLAHGEPGERLTGRGIAFLIPIEGTDVYSGSFMMAYGPTKYQRFRYLVEAAIAGTQSI